MAYIMCTPEAAMPIKSYSPDIIVFPLLSSTSSESVEMDLIESVIKRAHVIVIGPGLSRNNHVQNTALEIITVAQKLEKHIVIDGVSSLIAII